MLKPEFVTGNDKDRFFVFSVYISRCIKLFENGSGRNLAKLKAREYVLVVNCVLRSLSLCSVRSKRL